MFLRILKEPIYFGLSFLLGNSRGEPDLLSWSVERVWVTSVYLELLCSYGSLEMNVCAVPHPLATSNPFVHRWDRRRFTRPREQGGLVVVVALYCHLVTSTSEISHQPART